MKQLKTEPLVAFKELYSTLKRVKPKLSEKPVCMQPFQKRLTFKKNKAVSYEKAHQDPMVPIVVTPSYILSKNKTKYNAIIKTEKFFNPNHAEDTEKNKEPKNRERDLLLEQLHQQIADLELYLEEEQYEHKQSKLKAEQFLNDKVQQIQTQHHNEICEMEEKHRSDIKELEENHKNQFEICLKEIEIEIERLKKENSYLQYSFTSYQETLQEEMENKLSHKKKKYRERLEAKSQEQINSLRERLEKEKETEVNNLMQEHNEQKEQLKKDLDDKLESMEQYYQSVMEKLKTMNSVKQKLNATEFKFNNLKDTHADLENRFNKMNKEFTITRGLLKAFEDNFDKKVDEVDDHYKQKINNLLMMNSELRKTFRKKCEELSISKYHVNLGQGDCSREMKNKIKVLSEDLSSKQLQYPQDWRNRGCYSSTKIIYESTEKI